jgi:heme-degrading monooxygenase HmoA
MTGQVLSITAAVVAPESADALSAAYREVTAKMPHSVLQTALVRGEGEEWRIITLWRSREQMHEYRRKVGTSAAVKIFRDVGVEPTVTEFEVVHRAATE